jgi:hypothetical protein
MSRPGDSFTSFTYGLARINSDGDSIDDTLAELVTCAARATFNLLLERLMALADCEIMIFVDALKTCGLVSDETGNLLPALSTQMHCDAFIGNENPAQFSRLQAVYAFPEIVACIHGRSIRADALQYLAELTRVEPFESAVTVRQFLADKTDPEVYQRLVNGCGSFRKSVQDKERVSTDPPPGSRWWTYQYYDAIAVFETLGKDALAQKRI